jgi:hypothetical protein
MSDAGARVYQVPADSISPDRWHDIAYAGKETMNEHPLATLPKPDPDLMVHLQATDPLVYADRALPR